MATLPKPVQRQLEQAQAIEAQIAAAQNAPAPADPPPAPAAPPAQPAPAPTPAEPAKPAAPQSVDYEQKFRTLQGMYNREVPDLRTKVATYESDLVALREQVRVLTTQIQAAQKPAETKAAADPKDIENFGADLVEMVQRQAQSIHGALRHEFDARLKALEDVVTGVSHKAETSLEAQFYSTLTALVPDWEEVNGDPDWIQWLQATDPVFGAKRQQALNQARAQFDAQWAAALFKQFKLNRPQPPKQETLDDQVTPVVTGSTPVQTPPEQPRKPMITQKFIRDFYNDVTRGRYQGRETEVARIENEINIAAAEGRIV